MKRTNSNIRRSTAVLAAAMSAALVLTACATDAGSPEEKIVLEFPSFQFDEPGSQDFWNAAVEEYEARYPNVDIEFTNIPGGGWTDTLTTRFVANDGPDITHAFARDVSTFASQGWFASLDPCFEGTDILDNWSPLQSEMVWEGENVGLLLVSYAFHLYYNEELLNAAGVTEVPTTVEEFASAIQAVTDAGTATGFAAMTTTDKETFIEASQFLTGAGLSWADDSGYHLTEADVIETIQQWRDIAQPAPQGIGESQRNELFLNGQAAMMLDGNYFWAIAQNDAAPEVLENVRIAKAPFEVQPGAISTSLNIPATADEATYEAACEFIKLVAEPEFQELYTEKAQLPAARDGSVTDAQLEAIPELALMQEARDEAVSVLPQVSALKTQYGEFSAIVNEYLLEMLGTDRATADILADLQTELESRLPLN